MDVGVRYLPDRQPDPAALAQEVDLTDLFGRSPSPDPLGAPTQLEQATRTRLSDWKSASLGLDEQQATAFDDAGGLGGAEGRNEVDSGGDGAGLPRCVYEISQPTAPAGDVDASRAGGGVPVLALPQPARGIPFQLWPSALALCRYLEDAAAHGDLVLPQLRCLELGAGLGTVGIAAALLGAPKVFVSDLLHVCPHLEANLALNDRGDTPINRDAKYGLADRYTSAWALEQPWATVPLALPWGEDGRAVAAALRGHIDLVLASDVVYWEHLHLPLLTTLLELTEGAHVPIIIAHLQRRKADKRFFKVAAKYFHVSITAHMPVPTYRSHIEIYRLERRRPNSGKTN